MTPIRARYLSVVLVAAAVGFAAGGTSAALAQGLPTTGPDVTVVDIYDIDSYGGANGFHGYAVGTTSCNIGDDELNLSLIHISEPTRPY